MRKILFALCCFISIVAQAQYKTMLKSGRAWQMSHHTLNLSHAEESPARHTTKSFILFVGKTFVDDYGRTCYEIIYGDERSDIKPYPMAYVYEEDGRLYESSDDCTMPPSPRIVLDFTPSMGGKYPYYNGRDSSDGYMSYCDVQKVDSIIVNGELCKRIYLGGTGYENENTYIVEGIGISNDNLLWYNTYYPTAPPNDIIEWNTVDAVYDDGNCIFRASDFSKHACNEPENEVGIDSVDAGLWYAGSEWDVYYEMETEGEHLVDEVRVRYRLGRAENGYMPLEKTKSTNGIKGTPEIVGYVRNEGNTMIYIRPVQPDGSIGEECLLYDFSTPFEYGNTISYGIEGGGIRTEYIDWQRDSLDYYQLSGDSRLLPAWSGIIYRYGYIGGPLELFQRHCVPSRTKGPKATNISHVIFTTKSGQKSIRRVTAPKTDDEITVPYNAMLTNGTKWEYLTLQKNYPQNMNTYMVEVEGDTIIGNRTCKLVTSPDHNIYKVVFEEGRKLYLVSDVSTPVALLDFGLLQGDVVNESAEIIDVDVIDSQDNSYHAITIDTGWECTSLYAGDVTPRCYTLIEGIGVSKDEYLAEHFMQEEEDAVSYLLRCWKGGTLVYQAPFYATTVGIRKMDPDKKSALYDLQGRRLKNKLQKGISITGDKKIIKR